VATKDDNALMARWLETLPPAVREALVITHDLLENFASNVQIAEALNQVCFRRAIDATLDSDLTEIDVAMRMAMALKSNGQAAKLKQQRLEVMREFEHVQDVPKPIAITYNLRMTEMDERIRRLRALGYDNEADKIEAEITARGLTPTAETPDE
jgi:hypothetical protein